MGYPWSRVKVKAPGQSSFPPYTPVFLGPNRRLTQPSSPDTSTAVPETSEEGSREVSEPHLGRCPCVEPSWALHTGMCPEWS